MNENMEVKSKDYYNEEISKETGLDKHFLKQIRVYIKDGRVFEGRFEVHIDIVLFMIFRLLIHPWVLF